MDSQLTIAIVTKKRPSRLARCLESIYKQSILPETVLVIDNDSKKAAYPIFKKFKKKLNIEYILEKRSGVPSARNIALKDAKTRFLGFIDDDCILGKHWVSAVVSGFNSKPKADFLIGNTELYNSKNLIALAQHTRDTYWRKKLLLRNSLVTEHHFDTKNAALNLEKIKDAGLKFDVKCSDGDFDSGDFDFGFQLKDKNLRGKIVKKMTISHEETSGLVRFLKRAYSRGRIASYIKKKWALNDDFTNVKEKKMSQWIEHLRYNFGKEMKMYTKDLSVSGVNKFIITLLIKAYERAYFYGYISKRFK